MSVHPDEQDWMQFLYEEHDEPRQTELTQHLATCSTCRRRVAEWQETMSLLDEWRVQPRPSPKSASEPRATRTWSWQGAVAMCLAFVVGLLVTKLFTPSTEQLRADVLQELRRQLKTDVGELVAANGRAPLSREQLVPVIEVESGRLISTNLRAWEEKNSANEQRLRGLLAELIQNQTGLRKDLESLALEAEAQILRTQNQLRSLQRGASGINTLNSEIGYPNLTNPGVFKGPLN